MIIINKINRIISKGWSISFFNRNHFFVNKYDLLKHLKSHQGRQCSLPQVRRMRGANTFPLRNQSPTSNLWPDQCKSGDPSDPQQQGGDSSTAPLRDTKKTPLAGGRRTLIFWGANRWRLHWGQVFFLKKNIGLSFEYFDVIYLFWCVWILCVFIFG